jgi:hypothetical protein
VESEAADDSGDPARNQPILFMSDASAEAERLALALRTRGYQVADVPLSLLPGRVAVQRPVLLLCDADAEGAVDALRRVREVAPHPAIPVVLLGERDRAIGTIDTALVDAVFARPVNVAELVGTVERLIGNANTDSAPPARGAKLMASSRPPGARGPIGPASARPPLSPAAIQALPLPPDLAGDAGPRDTGDAPIVQLSEDIEALLSEAERRFGGARDDGAISDEPGPEADADGPLPADVLAALDDPLDEDDQAEDAASGTGGFEATGSIAGRDLRRGHTIAGGGTAMTAAALDGTAVPSSEELGLPPPARTGSTAIQTRIGERPSVAPAEADEEARRARQQASTPKPPRPTSDDERPKTEPPKRPSVAVPTSVEHPIPEPPEPQAPPPPPLPSRLDVPIGEQEDRREPASVSTTPPQRARPAPSDPPPARSEPPAARTEPPGPVRPSELPRSSSAPREEQLDLPRTLRAGDAVQVLARAIRTRFTGGLAFEVDEGIRRVVLRDGDFVTAASGVHSESLVAFLAGRGDLPAEVARQAHKLPAYGRRAGAALIAHGHLAQDQLWPVLRAHAEWLIGRIVRIERGNASLEEQAMGRLSDEPAVFGGATGAEVLVDVVRRVVPPEEAVERLGGRAAVLAPGAAKSLLAECALSADETERAQRPSSTVADLLEGVADPSFASGLHALVALSVLAPAGIVSLPARSAEEKPPRDAIDDDALRAKILARKALVDEGDYFALLGVSRDATGYDIRRAYTTLRREYEPSRVLTAGTADLGDMLDEIVEVLDEAYQILSDQRRRDRYRRAIEAVP